MIGIDSIRERNERVAQEAAAKRLTPFVYFTAEDVKPGFPFPFIGDHRPQGWTLVDDHFVDSSGLGAPDEPALTADQFVQVVKDRIAATDGTVGWALISAGQFQVYVGEFTRDS